MASGKDRVEATIVGNVIKGYINGVEVISTIANTYKEGIPRCGSISASSRAMRTLDSRLTR
jgi:hypothetical protein